MKAYERLNLQLQLLAASQRAIIIDLGIGSTRQVNKPPYDYADELKEVEYQLTTIVKGIKEEL